MWTVGAEYRLDIDCELGEVEFGHLLYRLPQQRVLQCVLDQLGPFGLVNRHCHRS